MRRTHWILIAVAVLAVAGGWMWRSRTSSGAPKFRTATAERGEVAFTVSATGTVQPVEKVEVGSQVSGTVYRLHADYNSRVTAGRELCELEPSGFRARVAQNEASVARAEASLEDARRQLRRANELSVQQLVSQADLEAAEVAVQQRQADLKAARAQLDAVRVDLRNSVIRAPISGVIISRNIDLGQTVAASLQAPKLFVIARDLTQMQVETRIDEADIGVVRPGLPVTFTVDAFPDNLFRGEVLVVRLEPIVEQGVVTYTTVIRTQNPDLKLRPGMTANVSVLVARHEEVLKVPAAALRFRPPETGKDGRSGGQRATLAASGPAVGAGGSAVSAGGSPGITAGGGMSAGDAPDSLRRGATARGPGRMREGGMPGTSGGGATAHAAGGGSWRGGARETAAGTPGMSAQAVAGGSMVAGGDAGLPAPKPGTVYVLRNGKPVQVPVVTGLSDGTTVEILSGDLKPGDEVLTGVETAARGQALTPPPGMGGPMMGRGPGAGGRR